jgi:hypothetical protein
MKGPEASQACWLGWQTMVGYLYWYIGYVMVGGGGGGGGGGLQMPLIAAELLTGAQPHNNNKNAQQY